MDKCGIRREVSALKKAMNDGDRQREALAVIDRLECIVEFCRARRVLAYNSLPDELSTARLLDMYRDRKQLFLPRVNGDDLEILPYDPDGIRVGSFSIGEPVGDELIDPAVIDLVIVPAVAYDCYGNRIGRGKGYYDRLLERMRHAVKIGVCYDCQLVDDIDVEPHDCPVDMVVTASGTHRHFEDSSSGIITLDIKDVDHS